MNIVRVLAVVSALAGVISCQGDETFPEIGRHSSTLARHETLVEGNKRLLSEGWLLREATRVRESGDVLSKQDYAPKGWYRATVPGTVLTTLVNEGVYPEPLYGTNNLLIPESLNKTQFWYRKSFNLPAEFAGKEVWLNLDGINYAAELWLNGRHLGHMQGAFKRAKYNITRLARPDEPNILALKISPPPHPGIPHEQTLTEVGQNGGALGEDSPTFVASIGWDWMPAIRDRNIGIWQEVYLTETGPLVVENPHVVTDLPLPDTSKADLHITAEVRNVTNKPLLGTLEGRIEGITFQRSVTVGPNKTTLVTFDKNDFPQLTMHHPRLWWPNGYGEQALYHLDLEMKVHGRISSNQRVRFGVREMSYQERHMETILDIPFASTSARYVRMYGVKRATHWGFSIWELGVYGKDTGATNLALHKPATSSSVQDDGLPPENAFDGDLGTRWSSAPSEPEWLMVDLGAIQAIDKVHVEWEAAYSTDYIIQTSLDGLDWQDTSHVSGTQYDLQVSVNGQRIMCKGGNWGMDEAMKRNTRERYEAQIRLHKEANLTMIRNWVGQTDDEDFYDLCDENGLLIWDDFWLANPVDGPNPANPDLFLDNARDKIKRYRNHPSVALWCGRNEGRPPAIINQGLEAAIQELDGTRRYQPTSNAEGVNGGGPYGYNPPEWYYENRARGFSTEVGLPSIPTVESVKRMMPAQDWWPMSQSWGYHDFTSGASRCVDYAGIMATRYGEAKGLEDFCRKGQMINYETHRAVFEAWNHILWNDGSGVLLWMSNPAQPSFVWQIYDYYLEPNASFFGAKKAAEPLHIQLNLHDQSVYVINNKLRPVHDLKAQAWVYDLDGKLRVHQSNTVSPAANAFTKCFDLKLPTSISKVYFVKLILRDQDNQILSDNFYWRAIDNTDFTSLDTLPPVRLGAVARTFDAGKEYDVRAMVRNPSPTVAVAIRLKMLRSVSGTRILPAYYDDNYFSLLPGESREVSIRFSERDLGNEEPRLALEGWNVVPQNIPVR